jgi:carboxymethylenebutenolidase
LKRGGSRISSEHRSSWASHCSQHINTITPPQNHRSTTPETTTANTPGHKASDFDPDVLRLFDQYVHGGIDCRGFLIGAARFAVGASGAAGLLAALSPQIAAAQEVAPSDARLDTKYIEFASPQGYGTGRGYLATPAKIRRPLPVML